VAYECDGRRCDTVPACIDTLAKCKPVYKDFPGWKTNTSTITSYADLPANAKAYVQALCEITGVPLGVLSVSPQRSSTFRIAV
jgi:adenylosuccinate synthase